MANFICQRYSFITYIKYQPDTLLLVALYKAATEGYKFIRIGKNIVLIGHTQNNKWIKPYKCVINPFSKSQFLNESEIYTYKIDWTLLLIIKIYKKIRNKNILDIAKKLQEFNIKNSTKDKYYKFDFFKNKNELRELR